MVLLVDADQLFVVGGSEASLARHIDNNEALDLILVGFEFQGFAIDVGDNKVKEVGVLGEPLQFFRAAFVHSLLYQTAHKIYYRMVVANNQS